MLPRAAQTLLLVVVLALLAGCGFRLQGRLPLPASLAVTYIEADDAQRATGASIRRAPAFTGVVGADADSLVGAVAALMVW